MSPPPARPLPTERAAVRVFREARPSARLLLGFDSRLFDLSAYLVETGATDDLAELASSGWLEREALAPRLPGGAQAGPWRELEVEWDGNAPPDVDTPVPRASVGKVLALGKNFRAHAEEFGEPVPEEPLFFAKLPETLVPHRAEVVVPAWIEGRVDHEAELAVWIGRGGKDIAPADAMRHVAGYTVANDLTARSLQGHDRKRGHPWLRSKNLDGFCPLGPCLVPRDFLDLGDLRVTARLRGELRQDASTKDWVVDLPHALAWISKHLTLRPGDVVLMGTPAGVGPLEDGDEIVCAVEGIGELSTTVRRRRA